MRFVVDASVAVKLLVDEPDSDAARALTASGEARRCCRVAHQRIATPIAPQLRKTLRFDPAGS